MLIAVISDSHRDKEAMTASIKKIKKADFLFHLGDNIDDVDFYKENFAGEIVNIKGNCDFGCEELSEDIIEIQGINFFITHGHKYGVKNNLINLKYKAQEIGANVVLYGHTHVPCIDYEDEIWFINPGSISLSRTMNNTLGLIEINESKIVPSIVDLY
ncbi:metallophosphoesterase [Hathewaya limosa]|uniref:Phosphoesterase n=1 Tax=Hathewaya limosa TaxID=1536 RepID=A0ABU0JU86_HATLI|nr:metallophosphoesterase [Hathewaya limosa]MDQ0480664.1 putative phosphoesterase [Hathewaya limosa]